MKKRVISIICLYAQLYAIENNNEQVPPLQHVCVYIAGHNNANNQAAPPSYESIGVPQEVQNSVTSIPRPVISHQPQRTIVHAIRTVITNRLAENIRCCFACCANSCLACGDCCCNCGGCLFKTTILV